MCWDLNGCRQRSRSCGYVLYLAEISVLASIRSEKAPKATNAHQILPMEFCGSNHFAKSNPVTVLFTRQGSRVRASASRWNKLPHLQRSILKGCRGAVCYRLTRIRSRGKTGYKLRLLQSLFKGQNWQCLVEEYSMIVIRL